MISVESLANTLLESIRNSDNKTSAYDTTATVSRVEGDTAWVHIDGGVEETPVKLTIAAQKGDSVQVRIGGGGAFLVGNGSAPPTDDTTAIHARGIARTAETTAIDAKDTATDAKDTAQVAQETAEQVEGIAVDAQATANNAITNYNDINLFINGGYITEVTSPYDDITVDKVVFYEAVGETFGMYSFVYNGTAWELNGTEVNLIEYGINLEEQPTSGDTIVVNLVDVEGAVTDLTDQISSLSAEVDANEAKAASDLESAQNELQASIDANINALAQTQATVTNISTKTQNMGWSNDYGLVLYAPNASPDTGYKLQLAAQAINFRNGALNNPSSILASIAADDSENVFMMISDAVIENQLRFGKFAFIPRVNGNMSLKYMG